MLWYRFLPSWQIVLLPVFVLLAFLASLGPGLWITALNVKYRDFRYVIPFLVQFGLYISPVGFSSKIIPAQWRLVYSLNPLVGVIDGFRWCILGRGERDLLAEPLSQRRRHRLVPLARPLYVPPHGKELCRSHLKHRRAAPRQPAGRHDRDCMNDIVIKAENLSKRYLVGHRLASAAAIRRCAT